MHALHAKTLLALLVSAVVGLIAGTIALKMMGQPTPLG